MTRLICIATGREVRPGDTLALVPTMKVLAIDWPCGRIVVRGEGTILGMGGGRIAEFGLMFLRSHTT